MDDVRAGAKSGVWLLPLLLFASGCGFDEPLPTASHPLSPPPVPPSQAAIALSVSPSPIDAVPAVEGAPWSAAWTLEVRETAGLGGNIDFVRATLTDASGRTLAETELDVDAVSSQIGSAHIRGAGLVRLQMSLNFEFPSDVLSGDLHVSLQLTDDGGNVVSSTADEVIQVCVPTLLTPLEGEALDNGCTNRENGILWEFHWSECTGAEAYHLYVKQQSVDSPAVDRASLTSTSFTLLDNRLIPEEGRFGWFWRVQVQLNGVWSDWTPERSFEVEPVNTDCVTP